MKRWLVKIPAVLGLALTLPLSAPAVTIKPVVCVPTVERTAYVYDATPAQGASDNALTGSEAFGVWHAGHGVYWEGGTLYRMKARFYDAHVQRWLSSDPIGLNGGANLYAYCMGNPLAFLDFLGLCPDSQLYWQQGQSFSPSYSTAEISASANDAQLDFTSTMTYGQMDSHSQVAQQLAVQNAFNLLTAPVGEYIAQGVAAGVSTLLRGTVAEGGTAYRAINSTYAENTVQSGQFFQSGAAGRLGGDGIYANSSIEGAIAEFQYHNPGVNPAVFQVQYPVSPTLNISPPSGYFGTPLPFTGDANILTAPSLRAPGTMNLLIREGAVSAGRIQ